MQKDTANWTSVIVSAWVCWVCCEGIWNGTSRIVFVEVRTCWGKKTWPGSGLAGWNRRDYGIERKFRSGWRDWRTLLGTLFIGTGTLSEFIFGSCVWLLSIFLDIFVQRLRWLWDSALSSFSGAVSDCYRFSSVAMGFCFELIFGSCVWLLSILRDIIVQRVLWLWNSELIFGSGNDWYIQQTLK